MQKKKNLLLVALFLSGSFAFALDLIPDVTPEDSGKHIVINLPQQRMFVYVESKLVHIYPIAIGRAKTSTPPGEYNIGPVALNPTWHIPMSIQKERAAKGLPAIKTIAPGPSNPLGPVFIRFGDPKMGLGIHGTNAPSSVPGVRSHGCVRMKSPDALKMAKFVERDMPVSVIYQMASLNEDKGGQLWLAAYGDPYGKKNLNREKLNKAMKLWETKHGKTLNQARIEQTLKARKAQPVCISCGSPQGNKASGVLTPIAWTEGALAHAVDTVVETPSLPSGIDPSIEEEMNRFPWDYE